MENPVQGAATLVERRLDEIDNEKGRLERALSELNGGPRPAAKEPKAPRKRSRRSGSRLPVQKKNKRLDQAVEIILASPKGISASKIAGKMGIKPNYLYRVLRTATGQGKVQKKGKSYFPA